MQETDMPVSDYEYSDASVSALRAIISALSHSTMRFMEAELVRVMKDENVREHVRELMPYIYAAGFLSFAGREINQENMVRTFRAMGLTVDPEKLKVLSKVNVRSHLAYIYAYYFLMALGKVGSEKEILNLVKSLDIEPDPQRVRDVIAFLQMPEISKQD